MIIRRIFLFLENNSEIFGVGYMRSVIHSQKEQKKLYEHMHAYRYMERGRERECEKMLKKTGDQSR